jgi:hypothetical protein
MSDTRYLFWDGVVNVADDGTVDATISCRNGYLGPAVPVASAEREAQVTLRGTDRPPAGQKPLAAGLAEARTVLANLVEPAIRLRVLAVDPWFVPIMDLMAIKVKLWSIQSIGSLLLRIRRCTPAGAFDPVIYQEVFSGAEVQRLPANDISQGEAPAVKQAREAARAAQTPARCLSHCRVEIWISTQAEFADWTGATIGIELFGQDAAEPLRLRVNHLSEPDPVPLWAQPAEAGWQTPPYQPAIANWTAAWQQRLLPAQRAAAVGPRKTDFWVGCSLIEDIMAGRKALKIYDHEPTDTLASYANDKTFEGLGPGKTADGVTAYPDFRRRIRWALYQICAYTRIGMQLLREVAADMAHPVDVYPSAQIAKFIEGIGVNPAGGINDDFQMETLIEAKRAALVANPALDPSPAPAPGFVTGPLNKRILPRLNFAAKLLAGNQIGSTNGAGCASKFFFHPTNMLRLDADAYVVQMHLNRNADLVFQHNLPGHGPSQRTVALADPCVGNIDYFLSPGKTERRRPSIETPFFLALVHELVHARRFQLGRNTEFDAMISTGYHPSSMLANALFGGANSPIRGNVVSRYDKYNLEEFDTIEGTGVPVTLSATDQAALIASAVLPHGAPAQLSVTENKVREELGLQPRYRYVDDRTRGTDQPVADNTLPPRKFLKGVAKLVPPLLEDPDFGDVRDQINWILAQALLPANAVALEDGVNYFKYGDSKFSWCYFFSRTFDDEGNKTLAVQIYDEISLSRQPPAILADTLGVVDPALRNALAAWDGVAAPALPGKIAAVQRLVVALIAADPVEHQKLMFAPKLKLQSVENTPAKSVEAFAALKVMDNPNIDSIADKAMYLPNRPYDNPLTLRHMLIHEPMHMHSYQGNGFVNWDLGPLAAEMSWLGDYDDEAVGSNAEVEKGLREQIQRTFNEGATELFSRIVTYRLNCLAGKIVSQVDQFNNIPSYEYPTRLVCQAVRDIDAAQDAAGAVHDANGLTNGMKLLARAYYAGQWGPFSAALLAATQQRRYLQAVPAVPRVPSYWKWVSKVKHQGLEYTPDSEGTDAVTALNVTFGINWPLPDAMRLSLTNNTYVDPVLETVPRPLAPGMHCVPAPPDPLPPPEPLEVKCPCCNKPVDIPDESLYKN